MTSPTSTRNPAPRTPTVMAAELFLLLLPAGHLVFLDVGGAIATATDVAVVIVLLTFAVEWLAWPATARRLRESLTGSPAAGRPGRGYLQGSGLLILFGVWMALSALWGFHPRYAVAKGLGAMAYSLTAVAVATSGIGWRRATDAWLGGTALALILTVALGLTGPEVLRDRVAYGGGGVLGLPFPRISGPLLHPNMLGDYLLVSGLILWGRWPDYRRGSGTAGATALLLALAVAIGLALTVSTAWIAAGVVCTLVGRRVSAGEGGRRPRPVWGAVLRVGGLLVAAATLVAVAVPLDVTLGPLDITTGGIRPAIWKASLYPFVSAPLWGVGAAPFLAEVADPLQGGAAALWDAHNAYLSVLGQFGLVGVALAGGGLWLVLKGAYAGVAPSRTRSAMTLVLVAAAVNGFFLAGEDLRHWWALVGMVGLLGAEGR